jgi:peptide/nickel transport system permease protein
VTRNLLVLGGSTVVVLFVLGGMLAPVLAPYSYGKQDLEQRFKPPLTPGHPLGTDHYGRDTMSRVIYGARTSLVFAVAVTLLSIALGVSVGTVAGWARGPLHNWLATVIDMVWSLPVILVAVFLVGVVGPGLQGVLIALTVVNWAACARVVRGEVIALRDKPFVEAAHATGAPPARIVLRHVLPNVVPSVLVMASFYMALAILVEASLSFLGLGAQPPLPSWGQMIADGRQYMRNFHWATTVPGVAIILITLGFNLLGDGLRDVIDPRLRS